MSRMKKESKTGGRSRREISVYARLSVQESCQMQEEVSEGGFRYQMATQRLWKNTFKPPELIKKIIFFVF